MTIGKKLTFAGVAMLKLNGPNIEETFYDENGGVAWSSK